MCDLGRRVYVVVGQTIVLSMGRHADAMDHGCYRVEYLQPAFLGLPCPDPSILLSRFILSLLPAFCREQTESGGGRGRVSQDGGQVLPHSVQLLLAHRLGIPLPSNHHPQSCASETTKHHVQKVKPLDQKGSAVQSYFGKLETLRSTAPSLLVSARRGRVMG